MTMEALAETIQRVLRDAPFAMRQLAADAGLSYDVLRSWRSGRRRPSRSSAQRLADGLERRGEQLMALSRELRQVATDQSASREQREGDPPPPREKPQADPSPSRDQPARGHPVSREQPGSHGGTREAGWEDGRRT